MEKSHEEYHIVSYSTYIFIWISLIVLTAITVTVAGMNFASLTILVALFIAATKSVMVLYYFMHLKYESGFFKITFIITIVTLAIFIGLTFLDVLFR